MADYEIPKLTGEGYTEVPAVKEDTMKGSGPFIAKADFQKAMGFPTDLRQWVNWCRTGRNGRWTSWLT